MRTNYRSTCAPNASGVARKGWKRKMKPLHIRTPLIDSRALSEVTGSPVKLKMEALQPAASFKIRGAGYACQDSYAAGARRLVCASGGNAGYAVAYAAGQLDLPAEIVVPETTPQRSLDLIRAEGATVTIHGTDWNASHEYAIRRAKEVDAAYIHPFDDPRLWKGHATMIEEILEDGEKPGAVVVSVGGGGLMLGVLHGLHAAGWEDVPVIAVETEGAASFAKSVEAGELVTLDRIDTIATTLGSRRVAAEALTWTRKHTIIPWVLNDRQALDACFRFADDHRVLVEPACGAALATGYAGIEPLRGLSSVVFVICGGSGVSLELLKKWDQQVPR